MTVPTRATVVAMTVPTRATVVMTKKIVVVAAGATMMMTMAKSVNVPIAAVVMMKSVNVPSLPLVASRTARASVSAWMRRLKPVVFLPKLQMPGSPRSAVKEMKTMPTRLKRPMAPKMPEMLMKPKRPMKLVTKRRLEMMPKVRPQVLRTPTMPALFEAT